MKYFILLVLLSTGCATNTKEHGVDCCSINRVKPDIEFRYSFGYKQNYDSATGLLTRGTCGVPQSYSTVIFLEDSELATIKYVLENSKFLDLPPNINGLPYREPDPSGLEEIVITSPCFTTSLEASYDDRVNKTSWNCIGTPGKSYAIIADTQELKPNNCGHPRIKTNNCGPHIHPKLNVSAQIFLKK